MLEPYAMKVARTVLSGRSICKFTIPQLDTLASLSVNDEW